MELCVCGAPLVLKEGELALNQEEQAPINIQDPLDYFSEYDWKSKTNFYKHKKHSLPCVVRASLMRARKLGLLQVDYTKQLHEVISKLVSLKPEIRVEVVLDRSAKMKAPGAPSYLLFVPESVAVKIKRRSSQHRLDTNELIDLTIELLAASELSQDEIDFQVVMLMLDAIP